MQPNALKYPDHRTPSEEQMASDHEAVLDYLANRNATKLPPMPALGYWVEVRHIELMTKLN